MKKDWKTTAVGAAGAVAQAGLGAMQVNQDNKAGWINVALAALWALLGYLAKDKESAA